ncbi:MULTISPECIES: RNA methyltransferase [Shewanella]|uniref:RNA methyltransferase n=1 Tax=Shewanella fidelis TaxID=173509 RepID=A0AAW8NN98_9GAMM|nr:MULTISPECIES: RNA methyltransferase [Shewanella]MDR8523359.1 RNA methyltransferase [Shewanella fidelis]MDW4813407.1 RNA methyltransferase [Shewanella fidelis]MDW4817221.1 RNA methyltransferase [Shewanella fidelis]MDW4821422.1 RNA methyltransferase [Shewanella fidelis]MDW4824500.1 RNA methyltransferase [Shewanella fidelis]
MSKNSFVAIGLVNPKSPTNVGGIMRAVGCYSADAVYFTGKRYELAASNRTAQYNTDTKRASSSIPLTKVDSLIEAIEPDVKVVCVDLVEGAIPLPEFEHPEKAIYIFGPEDGTISQQVVNSADAVVYVPTIGCMNLAASVNVLLYDRLAKSASIASDELIRSSRDTNNRVRVKQG